MDFTGTWQFTHWYPTPDDSKEEVGEYQLVAHQKGDEVVFESTKDTKHTDYMIIRLKIDGRLATGTWHEDSEQAGPFEGLEYNGAGQLIVSEDGRSMEGMWAGAGLDRATNQPKIYTGRWTLKRLQ